MEASWSFTRETGGSSVTKDRATMAEVRDAVKSVVGRPNIQSAEPTLRDYEVSCSLSAKETLR